MPDTDDAPILEEQDEIVDDLAADDPLPEEEGELVEEEALEGEEVEQPEGEQAVEEQLVVFAGDEPEVEESVPMRQLRKANREKERDLRAKEVEIATLRAQLAPVEQPVPEPTFEGCGFDEAVYQTKLREHMAQKVAKETAAKAQEDARKKAQDDEQAKWKSRVDAVEAAASKLKLHSIHREESSAVMEATFSQIQQGMILDAFEDPSVSAKLWNGLAASPKVAKELSSIANPIRFAVRLSELASKMTTAKRTAPTPERVVRSSVAGSSAVDNQLKRLQDEADKTGDRTKVAKFMKAQKAKKAA